MRKLLCILMVAATLSSCEGIDCTWNNVGCCNYYFYSSSTNSKISLTDTLTVTSFGTDSILYNRGVNTSYLSLPMSYWNDTDTLVFLLESDDYTLSSTLYVSKTNVQHHESPDCPTTMFHQLTDINFVSNVIDSVIISRPEVNYLQDENIKVYFHTSSD